MFSKLSTVSRDSKSASMFREKLHRKTPVLESVFDKAEGIKDSKTGVSLKS